jgi:tetratricopeptide (TPR) repeat protein/tRNA A-37 threonylcarbamoyl transferase component Bud32
MMSGPQQNDQTLDLAPPGSREALRREFEEGWRVALRGGPRPQIDAYLARAREPDRTALRDELRQIDDEYQARLAGPGAAMTQELPLPPHEAPFAPTLLDGSSGPPSTPPGPPVTEHLEPVAGGKTIDYVAGALTASGATVAPEEGVSITGGDTHFSVGPEAGGGPGGGPTVVGYQILGELGRGGMGVVYQARQRKLNRVVALKMVLAGAHAGPHQLSRFQTEAEAVARLQHPNIVQIYEVGEHDGLPFCSLEFIDGDSLSKKIAGKPQPPREAAEVTELLALAMAAAHERGIIHRDLKPANVLLTKDGVPKITDFGLAKRLEDDSSQTKSGTLLGTPSYMSPEQARGDTRDVGPLSDLYALGAILYELLTGRPPFVGATMLETVFQVRHQEPVPPTRLNPHVPRDLETICLKCLQKEPEKRYPSCAALAEDLHRFQAHEPIRARPVGRAERLWRWCRRNPRVAALSTAVGVLLLAVLAGLGMLLVRYNREREAVAETRKVAGQRIQWAGEAIEAGNYARAYDLLRHSDLLIATHPALADVRAELDTLRAQVDLYALFKKQLDDARFACWFGSKQEKEQGRKQCRELLALYDQIDRREGRGAAGWPPLNDEQKQLLKEDIFEAFLVAALVEQELADGEAAKKDAARQAIDWLNRAEQILPGTRALYANRAQCWGTLGDAEAGKADVEQAKSIPPTSAVDHFWHGYADHRRGDEAKARNDGKAAQGFYRQEVAEYAAFLQLRPDQFWGYFNWAVCQARLVEAHDLHDDLVRFTACIRLRPDLPWPYNNRGTIHLNLKEYDLAVEDFSAALARNDHYAEAYANRGLALVKLDRKDAALEDFDKAIALNPAYAPAYTERAEIARERKQYAAAAEDYTQLLALGGDKAPLYAKRADAYRQLKRYDEAIADYDQLLALKPKDLNARVARGELYHARGDHLKAREDFTHVLNVVPNAGPILDARAVLNWRYLKDFDAALEDAERLAQVEPRNAKPHYYIGAILLGRRDYGRAREALREALALNPDYTEAVWAIAQIDLWQGKPEDALKALDPVIAKLPAGPPETLNVRGDVYRAMGRLDEAAADYRRMIEAKPQEPHAYVSLAGVYEKQGKPDQARDCYDRLVKAAPDAAMSYLRRAEFRRGRGEFDAALADCDRAAAKEPASALPALVRASIEAAHGQPDAAVADAERALTKAPKDNGRALYAAACAWSLAAGAAKEPEKAAQYRDRAAALLAAALDKGFHDLDYPEHNRMADDPALAAVRQLPRVRELLAHGPAGR